MASDKFASKPEITENFPETPAISSAHPITHTSPSSPQASSDTTSSSIPTILITDTSIRPTPFRYTTKKLYELLGSASSLICDLKSFQPVAFEERIIKLPEGFGMDSAQGLHPKDFPKSIKQDRAILPKYDTVQYSGEKIVEHLERPEIPNSSVQSPQVSEQPFDTIPKESDAHYRPAVDINEPAHSLFFYYNSPALQYTQPFYSINQYPAHYRPDLNFDAGQHQREFDQQSAATPLDFTSFVRNHTRSLSRLVLADGNIVDLNLDQPPKRHRISAQELFTAYNYTPAMAPYQYENKENTGHPTNQVVGPELNATFAAGGKAWQGPSVQYLPKAQITEKAVIARQYAYYQDLIDRYEGRQRALNIPPAVYSSLPSEMRRQIYEEFVAVGEQLEQSRELIRYLDNELTVMCLFGSRNASLPFQPLGIADTLQPSFQASNNALPSAEGLNMNTAQSQTAEWSSRGAEGNAPPRLPEPILKAVSEPAVVSSITNTPLGLDCETTRDSGELKSETYIIGLDGADHEQDNENSIHCQCFGKISDYCIGCKGESRLEPTHHFDLFKEVSTLFAGLDDGSIYEHSPKPEGGSKSNTQRKKSKAKKLYYNFYHAETLNDDWKWPESPSWAVPESCQSFSDCYSPHVSFYIMDDNYGYWRSSKQQMSCSDVDNSKHDLDIFVAAMESRARRGPKL